MTGSAATLRITKFNLMTLSITIKNITLGIVTLRITITNIALSVLHYIPSIVMLNVV
jgi:hypothetical protein